MRLRDYGWLWIPGGHLKRSFREELVDGVRKNTEAWLPVCSLKRVLLLFAFTLHPAFMPSHPPTDPRGQPLMKSRTCYTVSYTAANTGSLAHCLTGIVCPYLPRYPPYPGP